MWARNSGDNTLDTYKHVAETVAATHSDVRRNTCGNTAEQTQTWGMNSGGNTLEETQKWGMNSGGNTLKDTQMWGGNSGGNTLKDTHTEGHSDVGWE